MRTFSQVTEETEERVENVLQDLFWKLVELRVCSSSPGLGHGPCHGKKKDRMICFESWSSFGYDHYVMVIAMGIGHWAMAFGNGIGHWALGKNVVNKKKEYIFIGSLRSFWYNIPPFGSVPWQMDGHIIF